jgi:hypothetical protein
MIRVPAESVVTQMVDLAAAWDVAEEVGIGHKMYGHGLTIEAHSTVTATSPFTKRWTGPYEARGGFPIDYETEFLNLGSCTQSLKDFIPASGGRFRHCLPSSHLWSDLSEEPVEQQEAVEWFEIGVYDESRTFISWYFCWFDFSDQHGGVENAFHVLWLIVDSRETLCCDTNCVAYFKEGVGHLGCRHSFLS